MSINPPRIYFTTIQSEFKQNITPPKDADGYYELIVGGFNIFNTSNDVYPYEPVKELFHNSGSLVRKIREGYLKSEYGHPKRPPGMSYTDFVRRNLAIEETLVCGSWKSVELDFDYCKNVSHLPNNGIIVKGLIKPSGPYGKYLEESLTNPNENTAFSIRSITNDKVIGGIKHKFIRHITTWDFVTTPGVRVANKWAELGIESQIEEINSCEIDGTCIRCITESIDVSPISTENDKELANELNKLINIGNSYTGW